MSQDDQIKTLRAALSIARPFVTNVAESPTSWGLHAKRAVEKIDVALIQTDPDPEVQALINR